MNAADIKRKQTQLKRRYATDPTTALKTLRAEGIVDFTNLTCNVEQPTFFKPAGMHKDGGGDGTFACPIEIMLAGLVSCAGVTLAAVANAMHLSLESCTVRAIGKIDFRGTLAVDKTAPVPLTEIGITFHIKSNADPEKIAKLVELTHRYCVVHRTLESPPKILVSTCCDRPTPGESQ